MKGHIAMLTRAFLALPLLLGVASVAPEVALSQSKGVEAKIVGQQLDVTVDWATFDDALQADRNRTIVNNLCGTVARIQDAATVPNSSGFFAQLSIELNVTRAQCIQSKTLQCRGLICKPVAKEIRNQLFKDSVYLKVDILPSDVSDDGDMQFQPTPQSSSDLKRQLARNVPDYKRIERELVRWISNVFETSVGSDVLQALDRASISNSATSSIGNPTREISIAPSRTTRSSPSASKTYQIAPLASDRSGLKFSIIKR